MREENQHLRGENIQNKNILKVEKTINANDDKDFEPKIKKELSASSRMSAKNIKEINRLNYEINIDTDINGTQNNL